MSRLEKMRVRQQTAFGAPAKPETSLPETVKMADSPKKKPKKAGKPLAEQVVFACGCKVGAAHFAAMKCPGCSQGEKEKRTHNPQFGLWRYPIGTEFRGPDGTGGLKWDGELWHAVMVLPTGETFAASHSNVERLLRRFCSLYKDWLVLQEAKK